MGRALMPVSEYWRIFHVNGEVHKLFSVGGYSKADMVMIYPYSKFEPISQSEFLQ